MRASCALLVQLLLLMVLAGCEGQQHTASAPDPGAQNSAAASPAPVPEQVAGSQPVAPQCRLTMGWDPWEPYHYRDIGGEVRGLDIELVAAIARQADCSLRYDQEDWATLLERLDRGEIDLLSGATRTPDREEFAWFTAPYRTESFRLYIRKGERQKMAASTLEELLASGARIGTTLDYVYDDEVNRLKNDPRYAAQFEGVAVGEVNYDKLLHNRIDGLLEDTFVAAAIIRKKGLQDKVEQHPLIIGTGDVHLMLSKQTVDANLVGRLNDALGRVRASGNYDKIIERYLN